MVGVGRRRGNQEADEGRNGRREAGMTREGMGVRVIPEEGIPGVGGVEEGRLDAGGGGGREGRRGRGRSGQERGPWRGEERAGRGGGGGGGGRGRGEGERCHRHIASKASNVFLKCRY